MRALSALVHNPEHFCAEMREVICVALALVVLRVQGGNTRVGHCVEGKCFTVQPERSRFDAAQSVCQERGGHLMTVRTKTSADALAGLLKSTSGDFWLGLKYQCPNDGLKGYKWVTGDNASHFINWESERAVCSPLCASVSQKVQKWAERPCDDMIDGYLCEFANLGHCQPLRSDASVEYETPFGFKANELLLEIPQGSNATLHPLRTRHVCYEGSWLQAPWSCEVFGGGCEYKCVVNVLNYTCICPPGFKLDSNRVTCSKQDEEKLACKPGFQFLSGSCVDVDECVVDMPCDHECTNTEGSYQCSCYEGYKQSKKDLSKCEMHCEENQCKAECDINNNLQCNCPDGFLFEEEGQMCVDIDECLNNECDQDCDNTPGDFECFCREGFVLKDKVNCVRDDFEGSGSSTHFDHWIPTSSPPTNKPMSISSGSLLAIMVCIVACILLLVCLTHCALRRFCQMHNYDVHKGQDEIYDFQQVIIDKNSSEQTFPNRYLKTDT